MTLRINHYPKYAAVVDIPEGGCRTLCGKPRSSSLEYVLGGIGPNYPVPAIPLQVVWPSEHTGYEGMIYIDSLQHGEDDPMIRCCWDFYSENWYGKYQATYTDAEVAEGWGKP